MDYHLLNISGQKKNKPTFENRFGASQLSLTPLEENINKVNQSWNDDACTDLKEKDEKGTEKEKEKENEAEKEKEEDGEKEEEEEREKDVGEKQKEKDVEEDVVRHMDFTDVMQTSFVCTTKSNHQSVRGNYSLVRYYVAFFSSIVKRLLILFGSAHIDISAVTIKSCVFHLLTHPFELNCVGT